MASVQSQLSAFSSIASCYLTSSSSPSSAFSSTATTALVSVGRSPQRRLKFYGDGRIRLQRSVCRAMVQQAVPGAPAAYAKEMERLSAKESLLLAFKDAGGFEALVTGKTTDMERIDVNERITALERVNPTPRPTTSPFLEGRWNFEWFGSGSPGLFAARFLFERFPSTLASLTKMQVVIKDGNAMITAKLKVFNSIESKFTLSTKLTVEGPVRMKEEYVEGILETPKVIEETIPDQLKGALGQAVNTVQQLPLAIRDAFSSGLKVPLTGSFERLFMISYLDTEILIIRDAAGVPEVLTRLEEGIIEYES
ncbi:probable plastid-lipid-associated protein 13, chloroplastic [Pyrus communis]|uniref:probable plastid-lipid-associated protein 13, chloroplastic n=1 Tax=Pyrus communis TaxID=23211 RepID=UPI0035BF8012